MGFSGPNGTAEKGVEKMKHMRELCYVMAMTMVVGLALSYPAIAGELNLDSVVYTVKDNLHGAKHTAINGIHGAKNTAINGVHGAKHTAISGVHGAKMTIHQRINSIEWNDIR